MAPTTSTRGVAGSTSIADPAGRAASITRSCVHELIEHDIPTRILTRSPNITRDIDLFKRADGNLTVGTSIPSFDASLVRAIEPNAPPPMARWEALDAMFQAGVPRFVSFSPTDPTMDGEDIEKALSWFSAIDPEVVFHEPINPRGVNFEMCIEAVREAGYENAALKFEQLTDKEEWVQYALEQIDLVQRKAGKFSNLSVHSWPDCKLLEATSGSLRRQLSEIQNTVSPELFASESVRNTSSQSPFLLD